MRRLISAVLALLLLVSLSFAAAEGTEIVVPTLTEQHTLTFQVPDNEAMRFVSQIKVGWNLGNTFDAHKNNNSGNEMELEKYWCGIYTTPGTDGSAIYNNITMPEIRPHSGANLRILTNKPHTRVNFFGC